MPLLKPKHAALAVVALAFHTDMLLYYLVVPILPRYAHALNLDQWRVGLLFGSYAGALLAASFPVGHLTDRWGRRAVMLAGLAGLGASTLLFAFAKAYWLLVLARALQGVSGSATWLPGMALLADHFGPEERGRAMGTAFAAANLGVLLGPTLSGWLTEHYNQTVPFLVGTALVLIDAVGRAFLLEEARAEPAPPIPFRTLLADPAVRAFAGAMVLASGLWALLESTLPLHFDSHLHLGPKAIGLCFAAAAVAHTLTSPLMGRLSDRMGRARVVRIGLGLCLLVLPLPAFMGSTWTAALAMVVVGATVSLVMSPTSPAMADAVDRRESQSYGSAFIILNLAYSLGMLLGPVGGSALVQALGIRAAFLLVALGYGAYGFAIRHVEA